MPRMLLTLALVLYAATPFAAAETVAVRTPAADPELVEAIRELPFFRWMAPRIEGLEVAIGPEARGDLEVVITGLPPTDAVRRRLAGVPIELSAEGIVFGDTAYLRPGQVAAVRLPGGEGRSWIVAGRDRRRVAELVGTVLIHSVAGVTWRIPEEERFDYLVSENRYLTRRGLWRREEGGDAPAVEIDPASERDRIAERDRAWAELVPIAGRAVELRVPPERRREPALLALAAELDRAAAEMAARVPVELERPLLVVVERDFEALGRSFDFVAEAVLPDPGEGFDGSDVHLVLSPGDLDALRFGVARALVARAGIEPPPWIADGAALWLSRGWYGRSFDDWLGAIASAGVLPTAEELLESERQRDGSRVLWPPVAAALVGAAEGATLRQKVGAAVAPEAMAASLARLAELEAPPPARRRPPAPRPLDGISLAMSPGIEFAYHAPGVDLQLARFADLGANAVSIMPFAFQRAPTEPALRVIQGEAGDENDAGLIHASRRAASAGFVVFWKPHVYIGGSWPGEVEMATEAEWEAWWRAYRRYVVHQAVLAEFAGAEIFSVGVELGRTVGQQMRWRELIASVRRVYGGELTYAGNWWGDFDRVEFWDALDLVGVDAYFPLAESATADRDTLLAGARRAVDQLAAAAREHAKPVVLAELGYSARAGAWVAPHEEGGEYDEAAQRLAYDAFFEALGHPDWLAGVFLWKAYSHPQVDSGGPSPDFRFMARAAEAPIRAYFGAVPPPR